MASAFSAQNGPNSGSLRTGHRRVGHAGSCHKDKLGPLGIGRLQMPATGRDSEGIGRTRHGLKAGYSSGVAGVDARRATPPDPRPPRWGLADCCQLDPSHPTIVTCEVGREGRHAPRPTPQ